MKDGDSLNTILGYAKHVEGTQHSKNLSKTYLDTIKIPNTGVKVEAVTQKHTGSSKKQGSKHRSQSKGKPKDNCHNCATNHVPKKCPTYGKTCYNCNKKGYFKQCCRSARHYSQSGARWKSHSNQRQSRHEQHEISTANNGHDQQNDSSWFQYEQDSIHVVFSKDIYSDIMSNIQFNEIDGQGVQCVLTDLTLVKANEPNCSYDSRFQYLGQYIYHFKVDSGASGNLLPLCMYRKIFPNVTQAGLE